MKKAKMLPSGKIQNESSRQMIHGRGIRVIAERMFTMISKQLMSWPSKANFVSSVLSSTPFLVHLVH